MTTLKIQLKFLFLEVDIKKVKNKTTDIKSSEFLSI